MPEIGSPGLTSGDGKRGVGHRPQATAPILDSTMSDIGDHERPEAKTSPVLPSSSTSQWLHAPTEKNWKLSGNDSVNRRTRSPSLTDEAIAVSPTRDLFASVGCVSNAAST